MPIGCPAGRRKAFRNKNNTSDDDKSNDSSSANGRIIPISSAAAKLSFECQYCSKEYSTNGTWLAKHEKTCIKRPQFVILPSARNIPSDLCDNILDDFNISVDNSTSESDNSCALLDIAFTSTHRSKVKADRSEFVTFESNTLESFFQKIGCA